MSNGEFYPGDEERHLINQEGEQAQRIQAELARTALINLAFKALQYYAREDEECLLKLAEAGMSEGRKVGIYVLEDVISAPAVEEHIPQTLTLLLVPDAELGQEGEERLRFFVPVEEGETGHDLEHAEQPHEVYFEITDSEGSVTRYAINKEEIYEYVSAADEGEQVVKDDLHESVWQRRVTLRVDTGLPIIAQIHQDLVNKRATPQRLVTTGSTEAHPIDY